MPYIGTITQADIGRPFWRVIHQNFLGQGWGVIQPNDVDKRVYLCGGVLQIENNDQRDFRTARAQN